MTADAGRNPWLDVCRALAISLLLIGHGRLFLVGELPQLDVLKSASFIGVELFFVLSGFLIGGILLDLAAAGSSGWLLNFYSRRWWRTLPNYYLFLALNIVLVSFSVRGGSLGDVWKYPLFVQSLLWYHPAFFSEAWSLAIEEVFYFLFPLLFIATARVLRVDTTRAILLVAVFVIVASPLARMLVAIDEPLWDEGMRKLTLLRLDAIMVGVLAAWLCRYRAGLLDGRGRRALLFVALLGSTLYVALTSDQAMNASFFAKTLLFSVAPWGCAAIIVAGLGRPLPPAWRRPAGFLARISYSAYLANIPVALLLVRFALPPAASPLQLLAVTVAFIGLTVLVSWLVYRFYESVFLKLRDRLSPAAPRRRVAA